MRLDDFIVLGRTVPEASSKYGLRVCMAGYSQELQQLMRVYPLTIDNPLKSLRQATLELIRNPDDTRAESFKLHDAVSGIYQVSDKPLWTTGMLGDLAAQRYYDSIATMNAARRSLGFVRILGVPTLTWRERTLVQDSEQLQLFDEFVEDLQITKFLAGKDYQAIPYISFKDAQGWHCLQMREWGCFEYLRKRNFQRDGLEHALALDQQEHDWYALVGNMAHRRNVWLVIKLVHMPRLAMPMPTSPQLSLCLA